ncbi:RIO1-domain-containing protein [Nadsonia fulvescens var. elongata DSM 6958]|uniref:Serine/threonine-protein kinase RIO1 n=1 Tax=Nadsonia fulvescens var. elongata DSM 6958 TaxID=857566 RepID=A0A1E3PS51_9ASCO|nr:RIO1-domain-containing protein [Nadsonia fulvescens var. elongata DSM 6958]
MLPEKYEEYLRDNNEYGDDNESHYDYEYVQQVYSDESEDDGFLLPEEVVTAGVGGGNLTKSYNRQKRLMEMKTSTVKPQGPQAPTDQLKAKAPTATVVPQTAEGIAKAAASAAKKITEKESADELAKYAARINLNDDYFGSLDGGKGGSGGSAKHSAGADRSNRATTEQVLDPRTRMILFKMINKGTLFEINGCVSTGKEANVYHAMTEEGEHRAIKIYKTSILVFKDRDRYVTGEFRFRHGYSKHNPRKMVKLWAEKEFRNLKRLTAAGIPCPKPVYLQLHVLVMEFLGDRKGWPSPRLRDANIDPEHFPDLYLQLLALMRIMYQKCRLVHADLSEYNILYHEQKLYIIDVSQSVEHDHPQSLEFLRMDIKNVNEYFRRQHVQIFSEMRIFSFITKPTLIDETVTPPAKVEDEILDLMAFLAALPIEDLTDKQKEDDNIFRSVYIPQNLDQVYDMERDVEKIHRGEGESLIYGGLVAEKRAEDLQNTQPKIQEIELAQSKQEMPRNFEPKLEQEEHLSQRLLHKQQNLQQLRTDLLPAIKPKVEQTKPSVIENPFAQFQKNLAAKNESENNFALAEASEIEDSDSESENSSDSDSDDESKFSKVTVKKFEDKEANKERKKALKEAAREKRSQKIKKSVKKKLVSNTTQKRGKK